MGVILVIGLIQNFTNFIDKFLITLVGNSVLLYLIAFSFDFFFVAKELAGLQMKNNLVRIPLYIFIGLFIVAIILRFI